MSYSNMIRELRFKKKSKKKQQKNTDDHRFIYRWESVELIVRCELGFRLDTIALNGLLISLQENSNNVVS